MMPLIKPCARLEQCRGARWRWTSSSIAWFYGNSLGVCVAVPAGASQCYEHHSKSHAITKSLLLQCTYASLMVLCRLRMPIVDWTQPSVRRLHV
jgi:hypothetical protein